MHFLLNLGNNQVTDISWAALCSSSHSLSRLHAAACPRMTDGSLRSVAALKDLQHLDISLCNKCVCLFLRRFQIAYFLTTLYDVIACCLCFRVSDVGIQCLTEGSSCAKLRELNVSHCSRITDISVMRIAHRYMGIFTHTHLSLVS